MRRATMRSRSRRCESRSRPSACTTCSSISTSRTSTRRTGSSQWAVSSNGRCTLRLDELRSRPAQHARSDARVRRERASAPVAALGEPAVAARGGRHRRMDGHAARADPPRGGALPGRRRRSSSPVSTAASRAGSSIVYERSLAVDDALRDEVLLAYALNGEPLPPQHGYPLRLIVPGWYGMTHVKWLSTITVARRGVPRLAARGRVPHSAIRRRRRDAGDPHAAAIARRAARDSGLPVAPALRRRGAVPAGGARLVGLGADRAGRGECRRRRHAGPMRSSARPCRRMAGQAGASRGTPRRASTSSAVGRATPPGTRSRSRPSGISAATATTRCSASA